MDAIAELRATLQRTLSVSIDAPDLEGLKAEIERLRKLVSDPGGTRPPRDHMRQSIAYYRQHGRLRGLAAARSVCFGAAERFSSSEPPLIEEERFEPLLRLIDEYRVEARRFRRCYRGLLHAYFAYDHEGTEPSGRGRENWYRLRSYLGTRRQNIHASGTQPDWAQAIEEHENLLTEDPVRRYASEFLDGKREVVGQIRSRLNISDKSWLMRLLILAQIQHAISEPDRIFKPLVQGLLRLLEGHEVLEDEGIKLLLDRYVICQVPDEHAMLRERSVKAWKNPWFERNSPKWTQVTPAARQMVTKWLKRDLIRKFFEVLSEDRQTDQRRVKFWEKYHEQIDDMYFALGHVALHVHNSDMRRLRDLMKDHLLTLRNAGPNTNNAFIMMIGDLAVVEFGVKGHACYVYRRGSLPFALRGEVTGDRDGLRSHAHLERLVHMDRSREDWETKFADVLARHGSRTRQRETSRSQPNEPRETAPGPSARAIQDFCRAYEFEWVDNRSKGGNLAIKCSYKAGAAANQLRAWGFKFSDRRQFWWR